jgi:transcription elongation GreA/GreB family factor
MSRAFVKEPDGEAAEGDEPLPPDSPHPLYVTPDGLAALQDSLRILQRQSGGPLPAEPAERQRLQRLRREARIVERKLGRAILVDPHGQPSDKVAFGQWVTVEDDDGKESVYRIVGEDQSDPARGWISWLSPLAQALRGAEIGDRVSWRRPAGTVNLTLLTIDADAPRGHAE